VSMWHCERAALRCCRRNFGQKRQDDRCIREENTLPPRRSRMRAVLRSEYRLPCSLPQTIRVIGDFVRQVAYLVLWHSGSSPERIPHFSRQNEPAVFLDVTILRSGTG